MKSHLLLALVLQAGLIGPVAAATLLSNGSDGIFAPDVPTILIVGADGTFNFSTFTLAAGRTVAFDPAGYIGTVNLLAQEDVAISGTLDASNVTLLISTPARITVNGEIVPGPSLTLSAGSMELGGSMHTLFPHIEPDFSHRDGVIRSTDDSTDSGHLDIVEGTAISLGGSSGSLCISASDSGCGSRSGGNISILLGGQLTTTGGDSNGGELVSAIAPVPLPAVGWLLAGPLLLLARRRKPESSRSSPVIRPGA